MQAERGGASPGSLNDPTCPTNFSNPMYDSLHAQESIILSSAPPYTESSSDYSSPMEQQVCFYHLLNDVDKNVKC